MNFKKIVTHAGQFHADEIMAIAIVRMFTPAIPPVERVFKVSEEDLKDPSVLVIDIGGDYNEKLSNFDHHQDRDLEASNVLVFRFLAKRFAESYGVDFDKFRIKMLYNGLENISDIDRGFISITDSRNFTFNSIIRNMNSKEDKEDAFSQAIYLAEAVLEDMITVTIEAIKAEEQWKNLELVNPITKIVKNNEKLIGWNSLALNEDIKMLITPNDRGGWQVISASTNILVLPEFANATFRHNSGFLVVFDTMEEAIDAANIIYNLGV